MGGGCCWRAGASLAQVQATQASLANLLLRQPPQLPAQASPPGPAPGLAPGLGSTQSLSAEAAEDDQPGETPLDKAERRQAPAQPAPPCASLPLGQRGSAA